MITTLSSISIIKKIHTLFCGLPTMYALSHFQGQLQNKPEFFGETSFLGQVKVGKIPQPQVSTTKIIHLQKYQNFLKTNIFFFLCKYPWSISVNVCWKKNIFKFVNRAVPPNVFLQTTRKSMTKMTIFLPTLICQRKSLKMTLQNTCQKLIIQMKK